jgi:hypothetical protein
MKPLLLLVMTIILTGCARPGDHPISSNCVWIEEDSRSLNLATTADRRHLRYDAVTAEDVAIRWADKYVGHTPEYDRRQDECMDALFNGLAKHHGVDVALVRQYRPDRDIVVDSAVFVGFGFIYAVVAYIFAGWIRRRFSPDEPGFWVMSLTMAVGVSLVGLMVGILWSIIIETFRLNSWHLSYRMSRIPWRQHWAVVFLCGFVIFGLAALIRSRVGLRVKEQPSLQS